MKQKLSTLFTIAFIITVIGFLMDGDPKEPSMVIRFVEFFAMTATIFLLISVVYFAAVFVFKKVGTNSK
ncbi:hypothetical protein [Marixanthomonas spongiae]|uniref:Uncharacterized protein n=1 Tax=Marixanthomonas spongiae TaxID=2174845 RepID=A0A2U0HS78_9FLAO|nr:hypothetical protein [Marixanthomonas spongiae]PVW11610.1 hypothetical protein DDV96_15650 [Marixanthomonas spongiae]